MGLKNILYNKIMPALTTVTFNATTTDAHNPTYNGYGVWTLKVPASPEAIALDNTTVVDLHQTITIPADCSFSIFPIGSDALPGSTHSVALAGTWQGTGSPQALSVRVLNPSAGGETLTPDGNIAYLVIHRGLHKATT